MLRFFVFRAKRVVNLKIKRNFSDKIPFIDQNLSGKSMGDNSEKISSKNIKFYKDGKLVDKCDTEDTSSNDLEEEQEEMFVMGPKGIEWNGPTRGTFPSYLKMYTSSLIFLFFNI